MNEVRDMVCPTCGHRHPGGAGVWMCGCDDCMLLFDAPPYAALAPEVRAHLDDLERRARAAAGLMEETRE